QCSILAYIGYVFSTALLQGFQIGIAQGGVLFEFSFGVRLSLFALTFVIAACGAIFAIHRIVSLEPAAVFRA
ncbi:MAG: ABC transporter permease, partial [Bacteroidota bacterium]|nr:ABC transporter permease [Candidatus Kapabacteria bacterium]MDW8221026.1 ABC transporter permease [Bacteroidota bacterium]